MNNVVVTSSEADATAVAAVEQHHAQMAGALAMRVETLIAAASRRDTESALAAKDDLVGWCQDELVPHAVAEEKAVYPTARAKDAGRLLVDSMLAEHAMITGLVEAIARVHDPVRAAAVAKALLVMFESHLSKENELILPLLTSAADVSVAELLGGMHELLGGEGHEHGEKEERGCGGHSCGCGEVDGGTPRARRAGRAARDPAATILSALDARRDRSVTKRVLRPGRGQS